MNKQSFLYRNIGKLTLFPQQKAFLKILVSLIDHKIFSLDHQNLLHNMKVQ